MSRPHFYFVQRRLFQPHCGAPCTDKYDDNSCLFTGIGTNPQARGVTSLNNVDNFPSPRSTSPQRPLSQQSAAPRRSGSFLRPSLSTKRTSSSRSSFFGRKSRATSLPEPGPILGSVPEASALPSESLMRAEATSKVLSQVDSEGPSTSATASGYASSDGMIPVIKDGQTLWLPESVVAQLLGAHQPSTPQFTVPRRSSLRRSRRPGMRISIPSSGTSPRPEDVCNAIPINRHSPRPIHPLERNSSESSKGSITPPGLASDTSSSYSPDVQSPSSYYDGGTSISSLSELQTPIDGSPAGNRYFTVIEPSYEGAFDEGHLLPKSQEFSIGEIKTPPALPRHPARHAVSPIQEETPTSPFAAPALPQRSHKRMTCERVLEPSSYADSPAQRSRSDFKSINKMSLAGLQEVSNALELSEASISDDVAENVIHSILSSIASVEDLFNCALINKGFYGVYKRNESALIRNVFALANAAAAEAQEVGMHNYFVNLQNDQSANAYLEAIKRNAYVLTAVKSLILGRCRNSLRPETIEALHGRGAKRKSEINSALWRIWSFCAIFGARNGCEGNIVGQVDWLTGGLCCDSNPSFGKGNGPEGLSSNELYDMLELWKCLRSLLSPIVRYPNTDRIAQARIFGIFAGHHVQLGDDEGAERCLEEWVAYLLSLGLRAVLDLASAAANAEPHVFSIAQEAGYTSWPAVPNAKARLNFLHRAASLVYEESPPERQGSPSQHEAEQRQHAKRLSVALEREKQRDDTERAPAKKPSRPVKDDLQRSMSSMSFLDDESEASSDDDDDEGDAATPPSTNTPAIVLSSIAEKPHPGTWDSPPASPIVVSATYTPALNLTPSKKPILETPSTDTDFTGTSPFATPFDDIYPFKSPRSDASFPGLGSVETPSIETFSVAKMSRPSLKTVLTEKIPVESSPTTSPSKDRTSPRSPSNSKPPHTYSQSEQSPSVKSPAEGSSKQQLSVEVPRFKALSLQLPSATLSWIETPSFMNSETESSADDRQDEAVSPKTRSYQAPSVRASWIQAPLDTGTSSEEFSASGAAAKNSASTKAWVNSLSKEEPLLESPEDRSAPVNVASSEESPSGPTERWQASSKLPSIHSPPQASSEELPLAETPPLETHTYGRPSIQTSWTNVAAAETSKSKLLSGASTSDLPEKASFAHHSEGGLPTEHISAKAPSRKDTRPSASVLLAPSLIEEEAPYDTRVTAVALDSASTVSEEDYNWGSRRDLPSIEMTSPQTPPPDVFSGVEWSSLEESYDETSLMMSSTMLSPIIEVSPEALRSSKRFSKLSTPKAPSFKMPQPSPAFTGTAWHESSPTDNAEDVSPIEQPTFSSSITAPALEIPSLETQHQRAESEPNIYYIPEDSTLEPLEPSISHRRAASDNQAALQTAAAAFESPFDNESANTSREVYTLASTPPVPNRTPPIPTPVRTQSTALQTPPVPQRTPPIPTPLRSKSMTFRTSQTSTITRASQQRPPPMPRTVATYNVPAFQKPRRAIDQAAEAESVLLRSGPSSEAIIDTHRRTASRSTSSETLPAVSGAPSKFSSGKTRTPKSSGSSPFVSRDTTPALYSLPSKPNSAEDLQIPPPSDARLAATEPLQRPKEKLNQLTSYDAFWAPFDDAANTPGEEETRPKTRHGPEVTTAKPSMLQLPQQHTRHISKHSSKEVFQAPVLDAPGAWPETPTPAQFPSPPKNALASSSPAKTPTQSSPSPNYSGALATPTFLLSSTEATPEESPPHITPTPEQTQSQPMNKPEESQPKNATTPKSATYPPSILKKSGNVDKPLPSLPPLPSEHTIPRKSILKRPITPTSVPTTPRSAPTTPRTAPPLPPPPSEAQRPPVRRAGLTGHQLPVKVNKSSALPTPPTPPEGYHESPFFPSTNASSQNPSTPKTAPLEAAAQFDNGPPSAVPPPLNLSKPTSRANSVSSNSSKGAKKRTTAIFAPLPSNGYATITSRPSSPKSGSGTPAAPELSMSRSNSAQEGHLSVRRGLEGLPRLDTNIINRKLQAVKAAEARPRSNSAPQTSEDMMRGSDKIFLPPSPTPPTREPTLPSLDGLDAGTSNLTSGTSFPAKGRPQRPNTGLRHRSSSMQSGSNLLHYGASGMGPGYVSLSSRPPPPGPMVDTFAFEDTSRSKWNEIPGSRWSGDSSFDAKPMREPSRRYTSARGVRKSGDSNRNNPRKSPDGGTRSRNGSESVRNDSVVQLVEQYEHKKSDGKSEKSEKKEGKKRKWSLRAPKSKFLTGNIGLE